MISSILHARRALRARWSTRHLALAALPALALLAFDSISALAHAHMVHAQPAVGSTVKASPAAVTIEFSEGVVPRLSGISISDAGGKPVATGQLAPAGGAASLA